MVRRFGLPASTSTPNFREMCKEDIPQVLDLMKRYMARFELEQKFDTEEEIEHWFISGRGTGEYVKGQGRKGQVAWAYVVEVSVRSPHEFRFQTQTDRSVDYAGPRDTSNHRLHVVLLAPLAHHETCQAQGSRDGLPVLLRHRRRTVIIEQSGRRGKGKGALEQEVELAGQRLFDCGQGCESA